MALATHSEQTHIITNESSAPEVNDWVLFARTIQEGTPAATVQAFIGQVLRAPTSCDTLQDDEYGPLPPSTTYNIGKVSLLSASGAESEPYDCNIIWDPSYTKSHYAITVIG